MSIDSKLTRLRRLIADGKLDGARSLAGELVKAFPKHLEVLHLANVCAASSKLSAPKTVESVLRLTAGVRPAGELTLPIRARALAQYLTCRALLEGRPTKKTLAAARSAFDEAHALRPLPDFEALGRQVTAWARFLEGDFGALVDAVRATPGSRRNAAHSDAHPDFVGLAPVFATSEYRAWIEKQPRRATANRALDEGLLVAAGSGLLARRNSVVSDPDGVGRPARLLTLLHLGASLAVRDEGKETVVHLLAAVGDAESLSLVASLGAPLDAVDADKNTPLHLAAGQNRLETVRRLLALGASPHPRGAHRRTPAHDARSAAVIDALAEAHADFTLTDTSGRTPLDWAASQGHAEVAKALAVHADEKARARAADAAAKSGKGELSRALAARARRLDVAPLLRALERSDLAFFPKRERAKLKDRIDALGFAGSTWDEAIGHLEAPWWYALAVAVLARDALPPEKKPPAFRQGPRLVRGDLVVKGHLHVAGTLLVTGDLRVGGLLTDSGHDSLIAVAGSLSARAIITDGELAVARDASVEQFVLGHGNDHSFTVGGRLVTPVLVSDQHDVQLGQRTKALRIDRLDGPAAAKAFVPEVLVDGRLDRDALLTRARAARSVLR